VSVGQAFVILTAGIDLSVSGIAIFSSLIVSAATTNEPMNMLFSTSLPAFAGVVVALIAGASWGILSGSLVSRIGIPALIVTLGVWEITKGVTWQISEAGQIGHLPDALSAIGQGRVAGVPVSFIIFISLAVAAFIVLTYTRYGRGIYATGGNPVSAWLSGINVNQVKFSVYIISAFCAALGGIIFVGRVQRWSLLALRGLELDSIGAVAVGGVSLFGGRGTMIGVIIGVFIITVINNALSILGADPAVQGIVKGAIIFTAVAVDFLRRR
jgi:ribose/xylose/arabinose/galactoside ABC-type transport system permease subunit